MNKNKIISVVLIGLLLAILVAYVSGMFYLCNKNDERHTHNKQLLDQVKFETVYNVSKGFFKDCTFIVEERKTLYVFSGTITKCPGNPDIIESPIEVDGQDFLNLQIGD